MTCLSLENKKKSPGAKSGEWAGYSSTAMLFLARDSQIL